MTDLGGCLAPLEANVTMLRKTLALILVAGLASMGAPLTAQGYSPNTVWGEVPASLTSTSTAVLLDASGNSVATVPVVGGKFAFENVQPGQYHVLLTDAASAQLARSLAAQLAAGGVTRAIFDNSAVAAAAAAAAPGGGGLGTTGWILIAAGAAGITTAIILATGDDDDAQSPTR